MRHNTGKLKTNYWKLLRDLINGAGWDLRRVHNIPRLTVLGLKHKPINTIIDIGANKGQFARSIADIYPHARIFCFEPLPEPFQILEAWSRTQNGRVVSKQLALGPDDRTINIRLHKDHTPSSSILKTTDLASQVYPQTQEQVVLQAEQTTLDNALRDQILDEAVLIKMDVQGYEDQVIAGGKATLSKAYACIAEISLDHLYCGQATFENLLFLLKACGLEYAGNLEQTYAGDGHCIFLDAVFVRPQRES